MHATELPKAIHRDGWVYEERYDGWRMVAEKVGSQVTLTSRNGLDHTHRFPELVRAIAELDAPSFILDGEIATFDRQLASERQLIIPVRRLPANGLEAWDEVLRDNYEGMIAKDPGSAYTPGRTLSWLKVKQRGYRQEARGFHPG